MSQFSVREQLNTLTLDDLTATQIKSALGQTFSNQEQHADHKNAVDLVEAFQAVHIPTRGQAIPGTGQIFTKTGTGSVGDVIEIHQPAAGETWVLTAAQMTNGGAGVLNARLVVMDGSNSVCISKIEAQPASQTNGFGQIEQLTYDSNTYIGFVVEVTAGGAAVGDAEIAISSMKVVQ